jgi:hypothetical protein
MQLLAVCVELDWVQSGEAQLPHSKWPLFGLLQNLFMGGVLSGLQSEYVSALSRYHGNREHATGMANSTDSAVVSDADRPVGSAVSAVEVRAGNVDEGSSTTTVEGSAGSGRGRGPETGAVSGEEGHAVRSGRQCDYSPNVAAGQVGCGSRAGTCNDGSMVVSGGGPGEIISASQGDPTQATRNSSGHS